MAGMETALPSSLDSIASQMQQNVQEEKEQMKPILSRQTDLSDKAANLSPPEAKAAPKPDDYFTSPMESFGSGAGWLATFGSLLTRRPLTNALNSGAAVMAAHNQKNATAFKAAYDTWKEDTKNASDKWKQEQDWIKEQGGLNKDNASMISASTKNSTLASMAEARMTENYIRDQNRNNRLTATEMKMDEVDQRVEMDKQAYIKTGGEWTPEMDNESHMKHWNAVFNTSAGKQEIKKQEEAALTNFDYSGTDLSKPVPGTGLTLGAIKQYGDAIHAGAKPSSLGLGYSIGPVKKAVENYIAHTYPDFDMAKAQMGYSADVSAEKDLAKTAKKIELASNILDESIPSLIDIGEKYSLGPSTDLNKVYNFIKSHASDEDKSNFSTQLRAVTTDYALFIGRGRLTVHSDKEALKILNEDMGINSLKGFQTAVKVEEENVKRGIARTKAQPAAGTKKSAPITNKTKEIRGVTYEMDEKGDWYPKK